MHGAAWGSQEGCRERGVGEQAGQSVPLSTDRRYTGDQVLGTELTEDDAQHIVLEVGYMRHASRVRCRLLPACGLSCWF